MVLSKYSYVEFLLLIIKKQNTHNKVFVCVALFVLNDCQRHKLCNTYTLVGNIVIFPVTQNVSFEKCELNAK
jgi:uncharacterized lipoprotein YajG